MSKKIQSSVSSKTGWKQLAVLKKPVPKLEKEELMIVRSKRILITIWEKSLEAEVFVGWLLADIWEYI